MMWKSDEEKLNKDKNKNIPKNPFNVRHKRRKPKTGDVKNGK